jgi:S1-C subfamily serine protease
MVVLLALGSTAATAQSVLEQLQTEVSDIAAKGKMSVVTIEDGRLAAAANFDSEELAAAMKDVNSALKDIPGALKGVDMALSVARQFASMPTAGRDDAESDPDVSAQIQKGLHDAAIEIDKQRIRESRRLEELKVAKRDALKAGNASHAEELEQKIEEQTSSVEALKEARRTVVENLHTALREALQQVPRIINIKTPKTGTGFSIGDGYIVTTADVVDGMQDPTIVTGDGVRIRSSVVGVDPTLNLGLLKLKAQVNLPSLSLGDSNAVRVGNFGICVGNQAGESNCASLMFIGSIKSDGTPAGDRFYPSLFQIAGTLGAGASGSPLLNTHGEVVAMIVGSIGSDYTQFDYIKSGLATPKVAPSPEPATGATVAPHPAIVAPPHPAESNSDSHHGSQMGDSEDVTVVVPGNGKASCTAGQDDSKEIAVEKDQTPLGVLRPSVTSAGYAIPISIIRGDIEVWRSGKTVHHAFLGADIRNIEQKSEEGGVLHVVYVPTIRTVVPGAPAEHAGMVAGDAIVRFDGKSLRCIDTIKSILISHRPGDVVTIEVRRGNDTKTLSVTLGAPPAAHE